MTFAICLNAVKVSDKKRIWELIPIQTSKSRRFTFIPFIILSPHLSTIEPSLSISAGLYLSLSIASTQSVYLSAQLVYLCLSLSLVLIIAIHFLPLSVFRLSLPVLIHYPLCRISLSIRLSKLERVLG